MSGWGTEGLGKATAEKRTEPGTEERKGGTFPHGVTLGRAGDGGADHDTEAASKLHNRQNRGAEGGTAPDGELPGDGRVKPRRTASFRDRPEKRPGGELDRRGPHAAILG